MCYLWGWEDSEGKEALKALQSFLFIAVVLQHLTYDLRMSLKQRRTPSSSTVRPTGSSSPGPPQPPSFFLQNCQRWWLSTRGTEIDPLYPRLSQKHSFFFLFFELFYQSTPFKWPLNKSSSKPALFSYIIQQRSVIRAQCAPAIHHRHRPRWRGFKQGGRELFSSRIQSFKE